MDLQGSVATGNVLRVRPCGWVREYRNQPGRIQSSTKVLVHVPMHIRLPKLLQASTMWLCGASYAPIKDCKIIHWHI